MASLQRSEGVFGELTYPNPHTLRMVIGLHVIESTAQFILLGLVIAFGVALPRVPVLMVMIAYAAWNGLSWWHAQRQPDHGDCEVWVIVQLVSETLALASLLYFTGGATSPFVSLFLVPIAVGALCLGLWAASGIALLAAIAYTLLLFFNVPLVAQHVHGDAGFNFHVLGMWVNFLVSGGVLLVFLGLLSRVARKRAGHLSVLRERQVRNEQVMAMAGVAAGAAHSLGTPLSTIAIVLDELEDAVSPQLHPDIDLARQQLAVCRERLTEILNSTQVEGITNNKSTNLREVITHSARSWHKRRPEADLRIDNRLPDVHLALDPAVGHGLVTLLDNAADANAMAGQSAITMRACLGGDDLQIDIEDTGDGLLPVPGRSIVESAKPNGFGAGLMILRTNLERLGGTLDFRRGVNGCVASLRLPLSNESMQAQV
jgi:two-component system, sensor histidine kinase RegB